MNTDNVFIDIHVKYVDMDIDEYMRNFILLVF